MIAAVTMLMRYELTRLTRARWMWVIVAAGVLWAAITAFVADGASAQATTDDLRASAASLFLVGGLSLALPLGATTIFSGGVSGGLGLMVGSGAGRTELTVARIAARVLVLAGVFGVWLLALQGTRLVHGLGWDGPLAVHTAASFENHTLLLLAAAATSTVLGPAISAIVGLIVHVTAQAVVNLEAAADLGRLGSSTRLAHVLYNLFPRWVPSPMVVELQNRGAGGPAAPRFEINNIAIPLQAAGATTVLWTLFWCGVFAMLCIGGMRRRTL